MLKIFRRLLLWPVVTLTLFSALFVRVDISEGSHSFSIAQFFQAGTWTPTTGSQAGTWTLTTLHYSNFVKVGAWCFVSLHYTGAQTVASSNYLTFTLPRTAANLPSANQYVAAEGYTGSASKASYYLLLDNSNEARVYQNDDAQWNTTGTKWVYNNFIYQCQ